MKLTCPNCGRVHPLGEPYPQPGGRILCGCGRKLAVRYPAGALERLRSQGARFLDDSPPVRPTAPGRTLMPLESQDEPRKGWNVTEDEEATTLFRSEEIEQGLPPARPPVRQDEPPARRPTTITPASLPGRGRPPQRSGPRTGYVEDDGPARPDLRGAPIDDSRDDAPTAMLPGKDAPSQTAETEEAPPVRPGRPAAETAEPIDMASISMEGMRALSVMSGASAASVASSLEPVAVSAATPMPTLVPENSISVPIKPKLSRATVDGTRGRASDPILVEKASPSSIMAETPNREVHVFLPESSTTTPAPPPPMVPPPAGLEPMAAADPSARPPAVSDITNTGARRGATRDEIMRLRVPVEAPKAVLPKATGSGKLMLVGVGFLLLLVLAAVAAGIWVLSQA